MHENKRHRNNPQADEQYVQSRKYKSKRRIV